MEWNNNENMTILRYRYEKLDDLAARFPNRTRIAISSHLNKLKKDKRLLNSTYHAMVCTMVFGDDIPENVDEWASLILSNLDNKRMRITGLELREARRAFEMRFNEDKNTKEIADELNTTNRVVNNLCYWACRTIKESIKYWYIFSTDIKYRLHRHNINTLEQLTSMTKEELRSIMLDDAYVEEIEEKLASVNLGLR